MLPSAGLPETSPAVLQRAICERPGLTLRCYSYGIVIEKETETGRTEYPVSAEAVATALSARVSFATGILTPNTICILSEGAQRTVVEYRPPQKTPLWLEGADNPLRVPLPAFLMVRTTTAGQSPDYRVYAVAERPGSLDVPLYHAPLPNIYGDGRVCWGTVTKVKAESLIGNDLAEDWSQLLSTPFGSHSVSGKCKSFNHDIRRLYVKLEKHRARVYPKKELVPARRTLGSIVAGSGHEGGEP
jgi:E2/UBC family protein D